MSRAPIDPRKLDDEQATEAAARRIEVPHEQLAPTVLRRLIEEFVTRDGTDYGAVERTLDEKVAAVVAQLARGDAAIAVDSETIDIVLRPSR